MKNEAGATTVVFSSCWLSPQAELEAARPKVKPLLVTEQMSLLHHDHLSCPEVFPICADQYSGEFAQLESLLKKKNPLLVGYVVRQCVASTAELKSIWTKSLKGQNLLNCLCSSQPNSS